MVIRLTRSKAQWVKFLTVVLETEVHIPVSPSSHYSCLIFNLYILYILNFVVFHLISFKAVIPASFGVISVKKKSFVI